MPKTAILVKDTKDFAYCYCTDLSANRGIAPVCIKWKQGGPNMRCAECGHWAACHESRFKRPAREMK